MKLINYAIMASAIIVGFTSCRSLSDSDEPVVTGLKEVSFVLGGEFAQISYEPLSRAENSAKYIGINVYSRESSDEEYKPFAYGVFTSTENMKLLMSPICEYKFECTTLEDDKHKIAKIKNGDDSELRYPFCVSPYNNTNSSSHRGYKLSNLNKFVSSDTEILSQIKNGKTTIVETEDAEGFALSTKDLLFPSQMRYYGIEEDFKVATGTAKIDLKSMSFGLKITAENLVGEITLKEEDNAIDLSGISLSDSQTECIAKYSYQNLVDWWNPNHTGDKTHSFSIIFTWTYGGSSKTANEIIDVYRNRLTVISINLANIDKEITFKISEEEGLPADSEYNTSVTIQ